MQKLNGSIISPGAARIFVKNGATLIDVRSPQEYNERHIKGSINVPVGNIAKDIAKAVDSPDTQIVVYDNNGNRTSEAVAALQAAGYHRVYDVGNIMDWAYEEEYQIAQ